MRTVTWEDAIELLGSLTRPAMLAMIRREADLFWMRDAASVPESVFVVHGVWKQPLPGEPWPMVVASLLLPATRENEKCKGVALFVATPGEPKIVLSCLPEATLGDYAGDPGGKPSTLNGDHPWLYGLAGEDEVLAGLESLAAETSFADALA